jgi:hypothetical protein
MLPALVLSYYKALYVSDQYSPQHQLPGNGACQFGGIFFSLFCITFFGLA